MIYYIDLRGPAATAISLHSHIRYQRSFVADWSKHDALFPV